MEYECQIVSATKLANGVMNVKQPLCTGCFNKTCTNPIVYKKVSVMGIVHTSRMFQSGDRLFFVTKCDGFVGVNSDEI
jgi:hypothetical protein